MQPRHFGFAWVAGALVVGAVFGYVLAGDAPGADSRVLGTLAACESKLERAQALFTVIPSMTSLAGTVEGVAGEVITMTVPPSGNPFDEYPTRREVVVGPETRFIAYGGEAQFGINDVKIGEQVTVVADRDVKHETRFKAVSVEVARVSGGKTPPPTPLPKPVR